MNRIPGGVQTYSKAHARFADGAPAVIHKAEGCTVWESSSRAFIDFVSGLGCVILGHADYDVDNAVIDQIGRGIAYPSASPLEEELAELLAELVPGAEMARYGKNGADACAAAVRLARAVTNRDRIISIGYHGYQDWTLASPALGVPALVQGLRTDVAYGEIEALKVAFRWQPPACLIMEPVVTTQPIEKPPTGYLELCRDLCDMSGALLIYDEIVTGFRVALGGSQEAWNAPRPDLICLGKAMGNGYPISALVGKTEYMNRLQSGDVFYSTTFGGDCIGLAASLATIRKLRSENVLPTLAARGRLLMAAYTEAVSQNRLQVKGYPQRPVLEWVSEAEGKRFQDAMLGKSYLMQDYHNLTWVHDDALIASACKDIAEALSEIA